MTALHSPATALQSLIGDLSTNFRVVDLSQALYPGVLTADGRYRWPRTARRFELKQWISPGGHFQHFMDVASQVGTHVETPAHIVEGLRQPDGSPISPADVPLETFFGEAVVINCDNANPAGEGNRPLIEIEHLQKVRPGDIVLLWSSRGGRDQPALSDEAGKWLAEKPIKMIGVQAAWLPNGPHISFMGESNPPIPIIEELDHLEDLTSERVLFFGVPIRIHYIEATWIRAFAFEPKRP